MTRVILKAEHKKFADKYLACGKIRDSALFAGFSERSAHTTGNRLLKRDDIAAYIAARAEKAAAIADEPEPLSERIVKELDAMAFSNIGDFITIDADGLPQVDFSTATPEQLKAITSIATKVKTTKVAGATTTEHSSRFTMVDKYRGLELLGRHLGMFREAEQRVVIDVADRLLVARQRLLNANNEGPE